MSSDNMGYCEAHQRIRIPETHRTVRFDRQSDHARQQGCSRVPNWPIILARVLLSYRLRAMHGSAKPPQPRADQAGSPRPHKHIQESAWPSTNPWKSHLVLGTKPSQQSCSECSHLHDQAIQRHQHSATCLSMESSCLHLWVLISAISRISKRCT